MTVWMDLGVLLIDGIVDGRWWVVIRVWGSVTVVNCVSHVAYLDRRLELENGSCIDDLLGRS